jgi:hypothetical protein
MIVAVSVLVMMAMVVIMLFTMLFSSLLAALRLQISSRNLSGASAVSSFSRQPMTNALSLLPSRSRK